MTEATVSIGRYRTREGLGRVSRDKSPYEHHLPEWKYVCPFQM